MQTKTTTASVGATTTAQPGGTALNTADLTPITKAAFRRMLLPGQELLQVENMRGPTPANQDAHRTVIGVLTHEIAMQLRDGRDGYLQFNGPSRQCFLTPDGFAIYLDGRVAARYRWVATDATDNTTKEI